MTTREFAGYPVVRNLAVGGMTRLYVGLDAQQNRVVIRCLDATRGNRWVNKWRFFKSAEILAKLQHPHIVRLIQTGTEGKIPYMVLEFVDGRTLRDLILYRDPLLTNNTLSLMQQLAETLLFIHNNGYLHLDVKPENIMVRHDAQLVLLDFDLAVPIKRWFKRVRHMPGTPAYAAPELQLQRLAGEASDVYSFGVTAYEMLTFHKPFEGDKIELVHAAQLDANTPPTRLRQHNSKIPAALENLVLKCLAKNPADRYPSMSLIIRELKSIT
jgi:serine/threonine protein kinase